MIRRPPRSTPSNSSAASDVYKRQVFPTADSDAVLVIPRQGDWYPRENIYALGEGICDTLDDNSWNIHVWGNRDFLYILECNFDPLLGSITTVDLGRAGAPYYGRDLADIDPIEDYPAITAVDPVMCEAGVQRITLTGNNFSPVIEENSVSFYDTQSGAVFEEAEITSASQTEIVIRRPVAAGDSIGIRIEVVVNERVLIAEYEPYRIDPVMEPYGDFYNDKRLAAIAIDQDENLYVCQYSGEIYMIQPDGTKYTISEISDTVYDMKIGPDGDLMIITRARYISRMHVMTGIIDEWISLPDRVVCGDYDENGNLYVGGRRSDLLVIHPDLSIEETDLYPREEIIDIRIFDQFIYLLAEVDDILGIWRHEILDNSGSLGDRELVLDWSLTGEFTDSDPACFTFASAGTIYIGTDHEDPILILNPDFGSIDILYKNIIPDEVADLVWGNGNYLYMIQTLYEENLFKIDMGEAGAPYYGRGLQ